MPQVVPASRVVDIVVIVFILAIDTRYSEVLVSVIVCVYAISNSRVRGSRRDPVDVLIKAELATLDEIIEFRAVAELFVPI